MDNRIREAIVMLRRFVDTPYQEAARAYLRAQLEIAARLQDRVARGARP